MPARLKEVCDSMFRDGWVLGRNTTLCHYDESYYFIHWVKGHQELYTWNIDPLGSLTDAVVADVIAGNGRDLEMEQRYWEEFQVHI
jgi:hypothetical protein